MFKRMILLAAVAGMVLAMPPVVAQAELAGELGLLDLTADYGFGAGINPGTEAAWAPGDVYHLMYVTSAQCDGTSAEIADYNAFVQADADAEGLGAGVGVSWFALGSTATIDEVPGVDAKDNVLVTGPMFDIFSDTCVAVDTDDLWDFMFPNDILTLAGEGKNVWTGTDPGGTAHWAAALGNGGNVRIHWTPWSNWVGAFKTEPPDRLYEMVAVSSPLEVVPEPATMALLALGGLGLILSRKRR